MELGHLLTRSGLTYLEVSWKVYWIVSRSSPSSPSSYICHGVRPPVDPFRSHVPIILFKFLPCFLLPVGQQRFITLGNLFRGILFTCCIQILLYSSNLFKIGVYCTYSAHVLERRHHYYKSVMELGHFLTLSGLTYPEVSSKLYHASFCQVGSSVSLPWVICFEVFCLHVVSSFSCIPVICPKLVFTVHTVHIYCNYVINIVIIIIIIIINLSYSWATCWPVPVSRTQKSLQRSAMIPSASWTVAFHYPG